VYNQAVNHVRSLERTNVDVYELTKMFVTHKSRDGIVNDTIPDWTLDTPKDIRKGALWDLKAAYKAAFTNLKQGNIQNFNVGFRRKKSFPSIDIPSTALKYTDNRNLQLFPRYNLGELSIARRQRKKDLVALDNDCRLSYKNDCWYLYVPYTPKPKIVTPTYTVCALDPGGRTFQTLYSPDHTITFQHNRELHKRLRERLDFFQSLRAKKWVRSNNYRRRRNRIYRQIGWVIDALHYSTIKNLKSYQQILLPIFESQEMVKGGRLRNDSTRELMGLQHFKFKQRLQDCLQLQPRTNVQIVTEEFTSQTCGCCGALNTPTGSRYRCSSCFLEIGRDFNGARNILLKHLVSI
jgi:transposase